MLKGGTLRKIQDAGGTLMDSTTTIAPITSRRYQANFWSLLSAGIRRMGYLLPAMNQAKLDNQRDVVKNERRQIIEPAVWPGREMLSAMMYDAAHPYNWPVIGSMADLGAASLDDVKEFFSFY